MNADKGIKRQQRRLFIGQLLSFAGLFLVLGVIVFFLYERSIYQDIDHSLEQQKIMLTDWSRTPGDFTTSTFSDEHGGF